jgi:hypothetical protein
MAKNVQRLNFFRPTRSRTDDGSQGNRMRVAKACETELVVGYDAVNLLLNCDCLAAGEVFDELGAGGHQTVSFAAGAAGLGRDVNLPVLSRGGRASVDMARGLFQERFEVLATNGFQSARDVHHGYAKPTACRDDGSVLRDAQGRTNSR